MVIDPTVLNMICLLRGKKRVKLHWHKAGGYWSESWDAQRGVRDGHTLFGQTRGPEQLGYTLTEITYEDNFS